MKKYLNRIMVIISATIMFFASAQESRCEPWPQNSTEDGWFEWHFGSAPSILIDTDFHRSTGYASPKWWASVDPVFPLAISTYILESELAASQWEWGSWGTEGWMLDVDLSSGLDVSVGVGDEDENSDRQEYCKIVIDGQPASQGAVTLTQTGLFLDPREYEFSITAKSEFGGPITVSVVPDGQHSLFSEEIFIHDAIYGISPVGKLTGITQQEWQTYILKFTIEDFYDDVYIELQIGLGAGSNGGAIYFDEISLIPLNTDIAFPPDGQAGGRGFLQISPDDGNYYFEGLDEKVKFYGATLNLGHPFPESPPTHRESEMIARRLADQNCFNVVRLQSLEPALLANDSNSSELDPEKLDRFDYLIAQLRQHGIYVITETMGKRINKVDDGVPEVCELKYYGCRIPNMFDDSHINVIKDYINDLFARPNPYTDNTTYLNSPWIHSIIIANEFYLPGYWSSDQLNGPKFSSDERYSGTMPLRYSYDFDDMWNEYLLDKYGDRDGLLAVWGDGGANGQIHIPGAQLIWDSNFELSEGNEFTNTFGSTGTGYANDFWAFEGPGIQEFSIIEDEELGENPPQDISHAVKVQMTNNGPGESPSNVVAINNVRFWPLPFYGVGAYKYDEVTGNIVLINSVTQPNEIWTAPLQLKADTQYIATFWAKKEIPYGTEEPFFETLQFEIKNFNGYGDESIQQNITKNFDLAEQWQQYSVGFTASSDSYKAGLYFKAGEKGNGILYITGVNFYQCANDAIQDFSFESNPSSAGSGLWNYSAGGSSSVVRVQGEEALDNNSSLKIAFTEANQDVEVYQDGLDLRDGCWYVLAFYANTVNTNNEDRCVVISIAEPGLEIMPPLVGLIEPERFEATLKSGLHYYWIPFQAQATGINSTLKFSFTSQEADEVIYLDQVRLIGSNQIQDRDFYLNSLEGCGWSFDGNDLANAYVTGPENDHYCHIEIFDSMRVLDNIIKKWEHELDDIRLWQNGITLEKGRTYTLKFTAKTGNSRNITARILDVGYSEEFLLETYWKEFSGSFSLGNTITTNVLNATLEFYFGGSTHDVDIKDIFIEDKGELFGLGNEAPFVPEVTRYINFQPGDVEPVVGYEIDAGAALAAGGYGWIGGYTGEFLSGCGLPTVVNGTGYIPSKESTAASIDNHIGGSHWIIDLEPSRKYFVTAACGHPYYWNQTKNYLAIEDQEVFDGDLAPSNPSSSIANPYIYVYEKEVEVSADGQLDVYVGDVGNNPEEGFTALQYLIIRPATDEEGHYQVQRPLFSSLPILHPAKYNDIVTFYRNKENYFYEQISEHLDSLGTNQHILRTQNYFGLVELEGQAYFDATANNREWDYHPGGTIWNIAMLKYSDYSDIGFHRTPMAAVFQSLAKNKPFLHTEYNYWFPNYGRAEGLVTKCAYDALQDTDVLINFLDWHTHYDRLTPIDFKNSVTFGGMSPIASRMLRRNDIEPALSALDLTYTQEEILENLGKYAFGGGFCVDGGGVPLELGLVTRVGRADFNAPFSKTKEDYSINGESIDYYIDNFFSSGESNPYSGWYVSDDSRGGQLKWNDTDGIFTVNSPNTQIIVGYLTDADKVSEASGYLDNLESSVVVTTAGGIAWNENLGEWEFDPLSNYGFANISLTSLTDEPIGTSQKLLLATIAREANTGQAWEIDATKEWFPPKKLSYIGHPPVLAEPVNATVRIRVDPIPGYPYVKVWKLNQFGQRKGEVPYEISDGTITINLNEEEEIDTIWYVIERLSTPPAIKITP